MIRRIRVDLPSPLSPITMADGAGTADGDAEPSAPPPIRRSPTIQAPRASTTRNTTAATNRGKNNGLPLLLLRPPAAPHRIVPDRTKARDVALSSPSPRRLAKPRQEAT